MLGTDATTRKRAGRAGYLSAARGIVICVCALLSALGPAAQAQDSTDALSDSQRYIGIEEIKPGMEAYCLTDYGEAGIERFGLKVVEVIRNIDPGHDAILVMGTDDRFKHTGPVGGCSGSPVYIDDRLAGALAFGWQFPKDPLYGVTPIKEMLEVGRTNPSLAGRRSARKPAFTFDFSEPIDLAAVSEQIMTHRFFGSAPTSGATALPCPLLISGLPRDVSQQLASDFEAMGFMAVPGLAGSAASGEDGPSELKPGASLTIPLVTGDIRMNVLGTVTEVRGDRVYAFGHNYLGYGSVNLPMAGGKVYAVVSTLMRSFKIGTSTDIVGVLTVDEYSAISGKIGATPKMLPLSIRVERYNDPAARTYDCQVAYNDLLTAQLVRSAIAGAALQLGPLPPDHTIEYDAAIDLADGQSIRFGNVSTAMGLLEPAADIAGALALLMNNPYDSAELKALDFAVRMRPDNVAAHIWSVDVADPKIEPGQDLDIDIVVESFLSEKRRHRLTLRVPKEVAAGKYSLLLCGSREYERFLTKNVPYRFIATNYQTLVDALNMALNVGRTKLYCLLVLPPDGITLDKAELPNLPGTKAVVLQSSKRALRVQPYPHWIEKTVETGTVIIDKAIVPIVVEE
ncbi:MAG: hypothetical protein ACYTAS_03075 [Planctomycetota bacterium]|jgi:hypothetical protein